MKIESFDHVHIYSREPEEAAKFYIKFFGGEIMYKKMGAEALRIFLLLGGQIIVIGPFPSGRAGSSPGDPDENSHQHRIGLDHFGIRVKDLSAAIQELKEQQVEILSAPVSGSSGISYAFIAAPDGMIIELTQYGLLPKLFLKHKNII
jgi:catechol 2,3-dioxygenase-like lactoylglutathione lyase family enzyme